jgi:hypothetical protein
MNRITKAKLKYKVVDGQLVLLIINELDCQVADIPLPADLAFKLSAVIRETYGEPK